MYIGPREVKLLTDEIKGDELLIRQIIEKYNIGKRDYDTILDKIEKIERNTIRLVNIKREYDEYEKNINEKAVGRPKKANDEK